MGIEELGHYLGDIGVPITALATVIVAIVARVRSKEETGALTADALHKMTESISTLREALDKECAARVEDRSMFEEQVDGLREVYAGKIDEIDRQYRADLARVEADYKAEIGKLKAEYEERIRRIEQAYKDKNHALRERIRTLENQKYDKSV